MELEQRVKLARLITALAEDDRERVVDAYKAMGIVTERMGEAWHNYSGAAVCRLRIFFFLFMMRNRKHELDGLASCRARPGWDE